MSWTWFFTCKMGKLDLYSIVDFLPPPKFVPPGQVLRPPPFLLVVTNIVLDFCLEFNCHPVFYWVPLILGNCLWSHCNMLDMYQGKWGRISLLKFHSFQMITVGVYWRYNLFENDFKAIYTKNWSSSEDQAALIF